MKFISITEAAKLFGVSIRTIHRMIKENQLPAIKIGRIYRIDRSKLTAWAEAGGSHRINTEEVDHEQ
jgi:excisionase family DNA binding protein